MGERRQAGFMAEGWKNEYGSEKSSEKKEKKASSEAKPGERKKEATRGLSNNSLINAIENEDVMGFIMILRNTKDINYRDNNGTTPLIAAINKEGGTDIIHILHRKDIDVNYPDAEGRTPLWHARNKKDTYTEVYLLHKGAV